MSGDLVPCQLSWYALRRHFSCSPRNLGFWPFAPCLDAAMFDTSRCVHQHSGCKYLASLRRICDRASQGSHPSQKLAFGAPCAHPASVTLLWAASAISVPSPSAFPPSDLQDSIRACLCLFHCAAGHHCMGFLFAKSLPLAVAEWNMAMWPSVSSRLKACR